MEFNSNETNGTLEKWCSQTKSYEIADAVLHCFLSTRRVRRLACHCAKQTFVFMPRFRLNTTWFNGPCQPGQDADRARPCQCTITTGLCRVVLAQNRGGSADRGTSASLVFVPSVTSRELPPVASRYVPPAENRYRARFVRVSNAQRLLSQPYFDGFRARVAQARIC